MTAVRFVLAGLLLAASGTDPKTLVTRLGAPRYADRQAASAELEKIGREALSDLKRARGAKDAEIRSRAAILVERIEDGLLVSPTMVGLDFHDQPLGEVVQKLGQRSQLNLALFPANARALRERKVTLERPEAVPFWEALDLLCRVGDIQYNSGAPMGAFGPAGSRSLTLNLFQSAPASRSVPACISGPFRLNLTGIQFHRERAFTPQNNAPVPFPGAGRPAIGPSTSNEQFFATLQILAEPRLNVALSGSLKMIEAVDDLGQSLLVATAGNPGFRHSAGYNRFDNSAGTSVTAQLPLHYPEHPGRVIRRLRGTVPLTVSARKDDPTLIPLADSKGKSYKSGDVTLSMVDVRIDPASGQTLIELGLHSVSSGANDGVMAPEFLIAQMLRTPGNSQTQLEVVDTNGRPLYNWYVSNQSFSPDGLRLTLQFMAGDAGAVPVQIRYYELAKTQTEAEFLFENVDMP